MISVTIPGEPVGQGRPRAAVVNGKPRMYSPKTSGDWRARAAWFMREEVKEPLSGPLWVTIWAVFGLPKSKIRKRSPQPNRTPCTKRPDIDNVVKAILDAGNGILWADDAQVYRLEVFKLYGREGEAPSVILEAREA